MSRAASGEKPLSRKKAPRRDAETTSSPLQSAAAALVGAAVFGVYVRTLAPTVAGGDSGELIAAAFSLGVIHPPGYPLYTLLGKLFTLLPVGSIAWRVNLLSAACGAGAATLLFLAVARWSQSRWAALASASLFAFAPHIWTNAVTAEVFALNNLFAAGLLYLTIRFWETRDVRLAYGLFFLIGLGLTNHHTLVFYAIPVALFVLLHGGPAVRQPRRLALCALCGLAGLLPYLYIPLASARVPLMSWGDQTTLGGFLTHFFRREYGTFQLSVQGQAPGGLFFERIHLYIAGAFADLLWRGPVLAAAGVLVTLRQKTRALVWCWAAAFCLFVLVVNYLANTALEPGLPRFIEGRFWQQPHLLVCAFAGLGLAAAASWLGAARVGLPIAAVVLAIAQPAIHYREQDRSGDTQLREFLKATLDSLPTGALLLETGDQMFHGLRYMQIVERYRVDVRVLDQILLAYAWHDRLARKYFSNVVVPGTSLVPQVLHPGQYTIKAFFDANRGRFAIYLVDVVISTDARDAYTLWPTGLVDHVLAKPEEPNLARWIEAARSGFARVDPDGLARHSRESWEWTTLRYYWKQVGKHALSLAHWAAEHDVNRTALDRAAALMEDVLARWPEVPHELHRDLGVVYLQLAGYDPSFKNRMREQFEIYLADAPPTSPDVPRIRRLLEQIR